MLRSFIKILSPQISRRTFAISPHMKDIADYDLPDLSVDREISLKHPD